MSSPRSGVCQMIMTAWYLDTRLRFIYKPIALHLDLQKPIPSYRCWSMCGVISMRPKCHMHQHTHVLIVSTQLHSTEDIKRFSYLYSSAFHLELKRILIASEQKLQWISLGMPYKKATWLLSKWVVFTGRTTMQAFCNSSSIAGGHWEKCSRSPKVALQWILHGAQDAWFLQIELV